MERRGSITPGMAEAARRFHKQFCLAQLDPLKAVDIGRERTPRSEGGFQHFGGTPGARIEVARTAIWNAVLAVGGLGSPCGSALWHVVGWQQALKGWPVHTAGGCRDRAVLLVGFGAAMRRSELIALDLNDITIAQAGLTILVRRSKTDQEGQGREIGIPRSRKSATCPVAALEAWLELTGRNRLQPVTLGISESEYAARFTSPTQTDWVMRCTPKKVLRAAEQEPVVLPPPKARRAA